MASEKKELEAEQEYALLRGGLRGRMAGGFCTLQSSLDALQRYLEANTTPDVYDTACSMLEEMTRRIATLERISGNAAELACGSLTRGAGELAPLELADYLAETAACVNEELALRGYTARFCVEPQNGPCWAMATTGLVDGIVVNLLSNLLRARRDGVMTLSLGEGRTLRYRDNGPGMDLTAAAAVLEQGNPPRQLMDQGAVGLLLVREYAQAMGWALRVEEGEGLRICFDLPDFDLPAARPALRDAAGADRGPNLFSLRLARELDGVFGPAPRKQETGDGSPDKPGAAGALPSDKG